MIIVGGTRVGTRYQNHSIRAYSSVLVKANYVSNWRNKVVPRLFIQPRPYLFKIGAFYLKGGM